MGQINTRDVILLGSTTATTNSSSRVDIVVPQAWQAAIVSLNVTAASGTSPTLNVWVQKKLAQPAAADLTGLFPTGTAVYDDTIAFAQMTTTGVRLCSVCTGTQVPTANSTVVTTADYLQSDAALTAGDIRIGPIGGTWAVKYTVGGTSPSFTFSVTAQLIPFST